MEFLRCSENINDDREVDRKKYSSELKPKVACLVQRERKNWTLHRVSALGMWDLGRCRWVGASSIEPMCTVAGGHADVEWSDGAREL